MIDGERQVMIMDSKFKEDKKSGLIVQKSKITTATKNKSSKKIVLCKTKGVSLHDPNTDAMLDSILSKPKCKDVDNGMSLNDIMSVMSKVMKPKSSKK